MHQPNSDSAKLRTPKRKTYPAAKEPSPEYAGTDIEAFYAAQEEAAACSRDYAAGRRKR